MSTAGIRDFTAAVNPDEIIETELTATAAVGEVVKTRQITAVVTSDDGVETGLVTATVNSTAPPARKTPTVVEFMSAVVPWPTDGVGHVNLHYSMINPRASEPGQEPLLKGMGWPFRDLSTFVQRAAWLGTTTNFRDAWFCTSRQKDAAFNKKGNPKALRRHVNAMDLKAIWIDADVKPDDATGKHYTSMQEAWDALCAFRKKVGLPQFSAVVNSGGGMHIYWISDRALDPAQWLPYATGLKALLLREGMKCDAGLTTDDVRLLRVPGTKNHKYDPPREVELLPLPLEQYNFETSLSFLTTIAPVQVGSSTNNNWPVLSANFEGVKPLPIPMANDSLSDGIEKRADLLLDPRPVFAQCAFMRHAFANGGADYDNPLWNLSVLATTFMENGNAIAHDISRGHPTYIHAETQQQFERKIADKERGVGFPSCAAIQSNGCGACAACPHWGKISSPLKLATMKPNQGDGTAQQAPNAGKEADSEDEWPDGRETPGSAADNIERLVVPKDDHMGRARIYRSRKAAEPLPLPRRLL